MSRTPESTRLKAIRVTSLAIGNREKGNGIENAASKNSKCEACGCRSFGLLSHCTSDPVCD